MSQKTIEQCKKYIIDILDYANNYKSDVPAKLYDNTLNMAAEIAKKMRSYGDALSGKANPTTVSIQEQHFKLLQHLRLQEPEKYKSLVFFATIYPTLKFNDQAIYLVKFFKDF